MASQHQDTVLKCQSHTSYYLNTGQNLRTHKVLLISGRVRRCLKGTWSAGEQQDLDIRLKSMENYRYDTVAIFIVCIWDFIHSCNNVIHSFLVLVPEFTMVLHMVVFFLLWQTNSAQLVLLTGWIVESVFVRGGKILKCAGQIFLWHQVWEPVNNNTVLFK